MTKVQSLTMSGLGLVALVVGVILTGMAVTSAQEGTATPTAAPQATTDAGTSTTDDASDDSTGDVDSGAGCVGGGGAHGGWRVVEDAAATVLGLTEEDLHAGFDDGKTLTDIAADQGMSADDFAAAVKAQVTSDLQAKLDTGDITQDEFDEVTSDLDTNLDDLLTAVGHGPGRGGHGGPGGFGGWRSIEDAAATVLSLTEDELHAAFDDGKTLTDIAADQGMSADDFSAAVKAQVTSDLQAKLDAGDITQDEFDQVTSDLDTNLGDLLTAVGHGPGRGGHGGPGGFGGLGDFRGNDDSADTDTTTGA